MTSAWSTGCARPAPSRSCSPRSWARQPLKARSAWLGTGRRVSSLGLGPARFRWQRHQDRLNVAAGHQAEPGAAIVQQVELGVAAAPHQLVLTLGVGPWLVHVGAY